MKIKVDERMLTLLYVKHELSTKDIAELMNVSSRTILRRLHEFEIPLRNEYDKDEFGRIHAKDKKYEAPLKENNPNWKGGKTVYREIAFQHHKKECFHCKTKENLHIHHKDKNRYNNEPNNLRIVCNSCHQKKEHPEIIQKARAARLKNLHNSRKEMD